jgi:betaine-aldehyde dehydrogenase
MSAAARDIKNISLELGGKSAFIVFDDADVEAAVEWIPSGIFWNQGQVCSATSRLLVQDSIAPRLIERLVEETRKITIGPGLEPGVLLGPLVSQGQYDKVLGFIDQGLPAVRACSPAAPASAFAEGYFIEPAIRRTGTQQHSLARRASARCCASSASTPKNKPCKWPTPAARLCRGGDERRPATQRTGGQPVARRDCLGQLLQPTFVEAPWGGMKHSGIGRELGEWGLHNYLEVKQVTEYISEQPWGWYLK